MPPSIIVISKSPLGRAFAVFLAHAKPGSVVLLDPESRRAELMQGRKMSLNFGSEFSANLLVSVFSLKDFIADHKNLEGVKWIFSFQVSAGLEELRRLKSLAVKASQCRWVNCDSVEAGDFEGHLHLTLPWTVVEKLFGRLKVEKAEDLRVVGENAARQALRKLLAGHLSFAASPAKEHQGWKAWASRF